MKAFFKELLAPLADVPKRALWISLSSCALLALYIYFGNKHFFQANFADSFAGDAYVDWYQYLYLHVFALVAMGVVPLLIARFATDVKREELGLQIGDWRFGLRFLLIALPIMTPSLWINAMGADFQAEYPLTKLAGCSPLHFVLWELTYLIYYIGWEIHFRGFLQLGLKKDFGVFPAIMFQTALSTFLHIYGPKPFGETFSAIFGGVLMGLLALRTRSILWPLLFHWYLGAFTDLFSYIQGVEKCPLP